MNVDAMSRAGHDFGDEDESTGDERMIGILLLGFCERMPCTRALAAMGWINHGNSKDMLHWHATLSCR